VTLHRPIWRNIYAIIQQMMNAMRACRGVLVCCALLSALYGHAAELVILVPTATEMPMAHFEGATLVGGIHYDLGQALAGALGRDPRFVPIPRKRIVEKLGAGEADVLCHYIPRWLPGPLSWSQSFLPMQVVVVTDRAAARPRKLSDIAGQPVGTVLGYVYPELEKALGQDFVREDSTSTELNMRKLAAGRLHHIVTLRSIVDYRLKVGDPVLVLHPPLLVRDFMGRCAVSPKGQVTLAEVDRAVAKIVRSGEVAAIMARYR
jgi:ABC-type amino acid transport substrate-binding protein